MEMANRQAGKLPDKGKLGGRVSQVELRLSKLERESKATKDILSAKDNWNSLVRSWIDRDVVIITNSGREYTGILVWIDKFNLAIHGVCQEERPFVEETTDSIFIRPSTKKVVASPLNNDPFVLNKGSIESIRLNEKEM